MTGGLRIDPDLHLPSPGMDVNLEFYYYSQSSVSTYFGCGRTMSYNRYLRENYPSSGKVTLYTGEGEERVYTSIGGGSYTPPAGVFDTLKKNTLNNTWYEIRAEDQAYFAYDSGMRLASINDLNGNTHSIVRDTSNRISAIVDALARRVTLTYDSNRLNKILDWGGRYQYFQYDAAGNLTKVIGPTLCVTYYNYDASHNLTQLVDPEGYSTVWQYDTSTPKKVIRETAPGDAHTYFNYLSGKLQVSIDPVGGAPATCGMRTTIPWQRRTRWEASPPISTRTAFPS